jgi:hypothetical protein
MLKKFLLLAFAAVFAAGPVFALTPLPLGHPGNFHLSGGVTRVDVANSILEVNGLAIRVALHAIILRGDLIGIPTPPGPPEEIPFPRLPGPRPPMPPIVPPFPPFLPPIGPPLTLAHILVGDRVDVWGIIEGGTLVANRIHLLRLDIFPPPTPPIVTPRPPVPPTPPIVPPTPTPFPPLCRTDADCFEMFCPMVVGMDTPMCGPDGRCFCGPGRVPFVPVVPGPPEERPGITPLLLIPEERARVLRNIQEQLNEIARRIREMIRERIRPPGGGGGDQPPLPI